MNKFIKLFLVLLVTFMSISSVQAKTIDHFYGKIDNEVELEDPEFKKHFTQIKSTDQVEARYLLTPTVMEKLKELDMTLGRLLMLSDLRLSFLDKKILLVMKVRNVNNLLRLCVLNKPLYKQDKEICMFKDTLLEILEIVDELELDEKVGTY